MKELFTNIDIQLDARDIENINVIAKHAAITDGRAICEAVFLCETSLRNQRHGMATAVKYNTGDKITAKNLDHQKLAETFNSRSQRLYSQKIQLCCPASLVLALHKLNEHLRIDDDSTAISYALAFTRQAVNNIRALPGTTKTLILHSGSFDGAWMLATPLNTGFSNTLMKTCRKTKKAITEFFRR